MAFEGKKILPMSLTNAIKYQCIIEKRPESIRSKKNRFGQEYQIHIRTCID